MIKVFEFKGGLRKSTEYHFVIDDNKLIHLSKYAISVQDKGDHIEYEVDLSKLSGKNIIEISVSNSGIICLADEYPAGDLALPYQSKRVINRPLSYLNNLEFIHLTSDEKKFVQGDWKQYYIPMIEQIRMFLDSVKNNKLNLLKGNTSDVFISLPQLLQCQIESNANYPLSYLIPYSSNNKSNKNKEPREMSLEGLTKEIHQIWIASRIIEELDKLNALKSFTSFSDNFKSLDFKQSPSYPIAIFNCSCGTCSLWYEFDLDVHTMCDGMFRDAIRVKPSSIQLPDNTSKSLREMEQELTNMPLPYARYLRKIYENAEIDLSKLPSGIRKIYERARNTPVYQDLSKAKRSNRAALRPDIVILCNINNCNDLQKANEIKVKAFIECKDRDFGEWQGEIDTQIIPYRQMLRSDIAMVASLKKAPNNIKDWLASKGIKVIDEVYPGGKGEKDLLQIITSL